MKNFLILLFPAAMCLLLCGCGLIQPANLDENLVVESSFPDSAAEEPYDSAAVLTGEKDVAGTVASYEEFLAADDSAPLTVESYLQEKTLWDNGFVSIWLQDEEGAYYVYRLPCSREDYEAMTPGQKLRVTGFRSDFNGRLQIVDAGFRFAEGNWIAEPEDLTELPDSGSLQSYQNRSVLFRGLAVAPMFNGSSPFFYGWDNSGSEEDGSDLYFTLSLQGEELCFAVQAQLRDPTSEVYRAVQGLRVGNVVDVTAVLSWNNGPLPLVTSLSVPSSETDIP